MFSFSSQVCDSEEFLLLFINRNEKLVEFLEHVLEVFLFLIIYATSLLCEKKVFINLNLIKQQAHPNSQNALHFALLEQYLVMWSKKISDGELEKKITQLLQHPSVLSASDRALFLCQTNKFRPGVLFIFEKTKLYEEILQFYSGENDFDNVITTCRRLAFLDFIFICLHHLN